MKELFNKLVVRIQNPKVIVAVVSGVLLILSNTGIVTVEHVNHVSEILNTVLTVLVALGVFGNPESHVSTNKAEIVQALTQAVLQPEPQAPQAPVQQ
jgi:uncharacterized membrane protein